jgi:sec-independent protein translocase protein TatA
MIPGFHGFDLIIILVITLLIFGPKKLPEMGAAVGKSIKEYRKSMKEVTSPEEVLKETPPLLKNEAREPERDSVRTSNGGDREA